MNLTTLLSKGYFPKELPPPFNTEMFALRAGAISKKWNLILEKNKLRKEEESAKDAERRFYQEYIFKYGSSGYLTFSIKKGIHSRRQLGIPNPKQYYDLCKNIITHRKILRSTYGKNHWSASSPTEGGSRAMSTKTKTFNDFKFLLIEKSFNKKYELRLDINQFYPSIYTHSIPWAIMGKSNAKRFFREKNKLKSKWSALVQTNPDAKLYADCELLDTLIRNCQDRQSVGLPIGPDSSFILAEVVGSAIDNEIATKIADLDFNCIRYYDDYYFYVSTFGDAERILRVVQSVWNSYNLEANEDKIKINQLPFSFEPAWTTPLTNFTFRSANKYELVNFFSIVFQLIEKNEKDSNWIISHALGRFEFGNIRIPEDSWETFVSLLIKLTLTDATNIDKFLKIILSYQSRLTKPLRKRIGTLIQTIIEANIGLGHSFEVSWSLWIARTLELKLPSDLFKLILKSDDYISKIICLDLIASGIYKGKKPSLKQLADSLNDTDLFTEKWLFTYQAIKKKWLNRTSALLDGHEYLKVLFDYNVDFYDSSKQITPEFNIDAYHFNIFGNT